MHGMAIIAFFQGMIFGKSLPVLVLVGRENARSLAQRANTVQGGQYGRADKFRAIGNSLHGVPKRFIHFESHDLLFFLGSHGSKFSVIGMQLTVSDKRSAIGLLSLRLIMTYFFRCHIYLSEPGRVGPELTGDTPRLCFFSTTFIIRGSIKFKADNITLYYQPIIWQYPLISR
jgi:hypothetical protein